ncbi:MAG: extracellular solute-binding protein [Lachnospiraceae bacterium]|nr:extracellular solute-binding protein [Lachnospiraceae bacterium]
MRNTWKRTLAFILSVVMLLGLTACSQTEPEQGGKESTAASETKAPETQGAQETRAPEEELEPITLTWMVMNYSSPGIHTEENPALKYIYDKLKIEIDFISYDQDMLTLQAAGDDLADIVELQYNIGSQLVESEQIIPLDDLLEEYGQTVLERWGDTLEVSRQNLGNGEHIYSIPRGKIEANVDSPALDGAGGFYIRRDIYKAIGAPKMETRDELLNVLKQMQDYARDYYGRDDIYGTAFKATSGAGSNSCIFIQHDGYTWYDAGSAIHIETGELKHMLTDPDSEQWDAIYFWNKAYRMGLLHPESFTNSDAYGLITSGKALSGIQWGDTVLDKEEFGDTALMTWVEGVFDYYLGIYESPAPLGGGVSNSATAISANCEYPERAMQLINFLNTDEGLRLIYNGVQGVDWDYVDGVPQYIGEVGAAYAKSAADGDAARIKKCVDYAHTLANLGVNYVCDDGYPALLTLSAPYLASQIDSAYLAYVQDYDPEFTYPGQVYDKWIKEGTAKTDISDKAAMIYGLRGLLSIENQQKFQAANEVFKANIASLLTAESDDAFEKLKLEVIEKFLQVGLGDVDAEWELLHAEAIQKYEDLLSK